MSKITLINIREAVEQEIRKTLSDMVSRMTPTKPKMGVSGYSCGGCGRSLVTNAHYCHNCGRVIQW